MSSFDSVMESSSMEETSKENVVKCNPAIDVNIADLQSNNSSNQNDAEFQILKTLGQQQKNVLNTFLAKLVTTQPKNDDGFINPANADLQIENSPNQSDEDFQKLKTLSKQQKNVLNKFLAKVMSTQPKNDEGFININTDNTNVNNVLAKLPPTSNIVSLRGNFSDVAQFTEDACFSDITVVSLQKTSKQARILLLGNETMDNATVNEQDESNGYVSLDEEGLQVKPNDSVQNNLIPLNTIRSEDNESSDEEPDIEHINLASSKYEEESSSPSEDPYALSSCGDKDIERQTIDHIVNNESDTSGFESSLNYLPSFVKESTLRKHLNGDENLDPTVQFSVITPAVPNLGDLGDCFENLKVVSLVSSWEKPKRIIFLGGQCCAVCKRLKHLCQCIKLKRKGGMCEKCGKVFARMSALIKHKEDCGNDSNLKCTKCDTVFPSNSIYKKHLKKVEDAPVCNYYQCKVCLIKMTLTDFREHIQEHPNFLCQTCGKCLVSAARLQSHRYFSHGGGRKRKEETRKKVVCPVCGKLIVQIKLHLLTHTERNEICDICNRSFHTRRILEKHKSDSHSGKSNACTICNKEFKSTVALKSHIQVVHERRPKETCTICNVTFARRDYYQFHMRRHQNSNNPREPLKLVRRRRKPPITPAVCNICNMTVKNRSYLRIHYKNYHVSMRYKCKLCSHTFSTKANQNRHELLHENPYYQFSCQLCFAQHKSEKQLQQHVKKSHSKKPKTVYQCYHCNEKFVRKFHLMHHIGSEHTAQRSKDVNEKIKKLMN